MTFKTVDQINEHLMSLVKNERKITYEILQHIQLFDKISGYLKLGYSSLFEYLTRHLKYSEDQAYRRMKVARLLNTHPEVAGKIQSGALNLTAAAQLQKAIVHSTKRGSHSNKHKILEETIVEKNDFDNKNRKSRDFKNNDLDCNVLEIKVQNIISQIENKNSFETQKIIAENFDMPCTIRDRVKPQSNKSVRLEIHLNETQYQKLEQVKKMLSHQFPEQKNGDILEHLCDLVLLKGKKKLCSAKSNATIKDSHELNSTLEIPDLETTNLEKENLEIKTKDNDVLDVATQSFLLNQNGRKSINRDHSRQGCQSRRHIPNSLRRYVLKRAQNKCEFISKDGVQCKSEYQVELEHVIPFSKGGEHSIENLKCFCGRHNAFAASQLDIGFEKLM